MKKILFTALLISLNSGSFAQMTGEQMVAGSFFNHYDSNQDGQVTRKEFLTPSMQRFVYIDSNHDGIIDGNEVNAFVLKMLQGGQPQ
jgi:Ca2+-binding EF-hand superfamily protein